MNPTLEVVLLYIRDQTVHYRLNRPLPNDQTDRQRTDFWTITTAVFKIDRGIMLFFVMPDQWLRKASNINGREQREQRHGFWRT